MAVPLSSGIGGSGSYGYAPGGGMSGFGGGGGTNDPGQDRRRPHAPREFTAFPLDGGGITARWRDQGDSVFGLRLNSGGFSEPVVSQWHLRVCPVQLAGSETDPRFIFNVLELSTPIGSVASTHRGDLMRLTISDPEMDDVYAQVVAISNDNIVGYPSEPVLVSPLSPPLGPLNNITEPSLNLVQVLDTYGNEFVEINPSFKAPIVLGRFFGVQLVATNYLGVGTWMCLGNYIKYQGKPGGQIQTGSIILPDDAGANATNIHYVSVDREGKHVDDITTAPNVALAFGIHV